MQVSLPCGMHTQGDSISVLNSAVLYACIALCTQWVYIYLHQLLVCCLPWNQARVTPTVDGGRQDKVYRQGKKMIYSKDNRDQKAAAITFHSYNPCTIILCLLEDFEPPFTYV